MLSGADIHRLLDQHGLRPSRALGQNFVADPNTVRRIVRLAGVGPGSSVVEIGAGLGSLTLALAEAGAAVVAVEVDRHLAVLRAVVADADVTVVAGDALGLDWDDLLGPADPRGLAPRGQPPLQRGHAAGAAAGAGGGAEGGVPARDGPT